MKCYRCGAHTKPGLVSDRVHSLRQYDIKNWLFYECTSCNSITYPKIVDYLYQCVPYWSYNKTAVVIEYEDLVDRIVRGEF